MNVFIIFIRFSFAVSIIFSLMSSPVSSAGKNSDQKKKKNQPAGTLIFAPDRFAVLNINNLLTWQREDGYSAHSPSGKAGVIFPKNTANTIYQDGIVWGAKAYTDAALTVPAAGKAG